MIKDGYQIEYIWVIFLHIYQLVPIESPSYRTLSSVLMFVGGFTMTNMDSPLWIRVGGRLTRVSEKHTEYRTLSKVRAISSVYQSMHVCQISISTDLGEISNELNTLSCNASI